MDERKITKDFLKKVLLKEEYDFHQHGQSNHDIQVSDDGTISANELHRHFDLDSDGRVTPQEYVDHVNYHAVYPESLDHYNSIREKNYNSIPCKNSYDTCSSHLLGAPDDVSVILSPLMDKTGSTCQLSTAQSLLDVLQSLINCGVFG